MVAGAGAVILAAGQGSRLGAPKALCRLGGRTFLERALAAVDIPEVTARVVVLGAHADRVAAAAAGAPVVVNPACVPGGPDPGQTSSVKAGLAALRSGLDACVILPVDFPLVTAADVRAVLAAMAARAAPLAVPSWNGRRGHPLVLGAGLVAEVLALPDEAPLHQVVRAHAAEVLHVPADHGGVLEDVDTPEDLARLGGEPPASAGTGQ